MKSYINSTKKKRFLTNMQLVLEMIGNLTVDDLRRDVFYLLQSHCNVNINMKNMNIVILKYVYIW